MPHHITDRQSSRVESPAIDIPRVDILEEREKTSSHRALLRDSPMDLPTCVNRQYEHQRKLHLLEL
eukprot:9027766-Ditylum_brightwellii.AAC.1